VYKSEIALWEDTAGKSPQNPRAYNNLGYAYALKGRKADARDAYRHALEIDPAFEHARNNLKMLDRQ
jgi:Flp pilus assembly protein TadD